MRKRRFKRSTASTPCCRCRPVAPSVTASNTTGMARSRCSRRSTRTPAKCSDRPCRGTPVPPLSSFSATSSPPNRRDARSTSSRTTSRRIRRRPCETFLAAHPHVHLHFTPTYSSWLNQVELWFAKIERDLLARGIFTSVADLARKIRRYIAHYNNHPKPIRWTYRNPAHRITTRSAGISRLGCGALVACPRHLYSDFRAGHPGWQRCSSIKYSRYSQSSRLAIRAPRSEIRCTTDADRPLVANSDRREAPSARRAGCAVRSRLVCDRQRRRPAERRDRGDHRCARKRRVTVTSQSEVERVSTIR